MSVILDEIKNWDNIIGVGEDLSVWSAYFGLELINYIPIKKGNTILDIGCGTGFPTLEIAARMGATGKIYALDPWEKGLEFLREKAEKRGISNVTILNSRAENIPLADAILDIIVSNNGISACKNKKNVFRECYRVLKKGGGIIFSAILPETMQLLSKILYDLLLKLNGSDILMNIEGVGTEVDMGQGMCIAKSGKVPVSIGQPQIRVSEMLVGGMVNCTGNKK